MDNESNPAKRPWRSFLRFTVRGLIVVVLIIGGWLGWYVRSVRIQRDAVAAIEKSRGRVWYHWQKTGGHAPNPAEQPSWPKSLVDRLGVDYFGHITQVVVARGGASDRVLARIGQLRHLEDLAIDGTFTDAGLSHLQSLHDLRILVLISPIVTDEGLMHLERLSNLEALELFCHVGDAGLAHLKNLTRLETLGLAETAITDAGLVHLKRLTKLSSLSLSGTQVTDAGLAHLKNLTSLQTLGLGETTITDAGLVHLEGLTKLSVLSLEHTQVTDAGVKSLQKALPSLKIRRR